MVDYGNIPIVVCVDSEDVKVVVDAYIFENKWQRVSCYVTDPNHVSGTDRIYEGLKLFEKDFNKNEPST